MSLRTGTELITLSQMLNKATGLYGLLAVLTGVHLSPLQLSMYIYSLVILALTAILSPHIRKQSPLQCLALAWLYLLDSLVNILYTTAFGITWFLVISQHHTSGDAGKAGPGGKTIDDTAGFTNPKYNVSSVQIVATPAAGLTEGQDAVAVGSPGSQETNTGSPSFTHGVLQPESMGSISVICSLWALRVYFILILLSHARFVLRQHVAVSARQNTALHTGSSNSAMMENPFEEGRAEGQGWQGRLGRAMVRIGKSYWLGTEDGEMDNGWMMAVGGKFKKQAIPEETGPLERERRRRSGTGPPVPQNLPNVALQSLPEGR